MPIFSIILPTFNRPNMLWKAVASVQRQSFTDFELIVVDDGSCDDYCAILDDVRDTRIRRLRSSTNQGVATARNVGVAAAQGRYISFLDDDDEYLPSFLRETYATLTAAPSRVALSWSGVRYVDHFPDPEIQPRIRPREFSTICSDGEMFEQLMSIGMGHGVTIAASCFEQIGTFDSSLKTVEDTDMFLRILTNEFMPAVVPGTHVLIHNHDQPRLTGIAMHAVRICECHLLLSRYKSFLARYPTLRGQLMWQINHLGQELAASVAAESVAAS